MNMQRMSGLLLLVVGVVLFVMGMNAADSFADRMSEFFTGRYTDKTVWYLAGGIALGVGGVMLMTFGGRTARA